MYVVDRAPMRGVKPSGTGRWQASVLALMRWVRWPCVQFTLIVPARRQNGDASRDRDIGPAIHMQHLPGHVAALGAAQEPRQIRDFLHLPGAP